MTELREVSLTVNGSGHRLRLEPRRLLVHCLRYDLGLTGTHVGCETADCGTCAVLLNGRAVKSCNLLAVQAHGAELTTIEGLSADGGLLPIQEAFRDHRALQCGFCTPGMIMLASELLARHRRRDDAEIRRQMYGNLCRCTGYGTIVDAIKDAGMKAESREVTP